MSYTVKFSNVGGGKASFTKTLPDMEYSTLKKAVSGAIMSRYPEFAVDDEGTGSIFCGFHCCGTFEWARAFETQSLTA